MTVSELHLPPRPPLVLPFAPETFPSQSGKPAVLFCPNLSELALPHFEKAQTLLLEMQNALIVEEDVESFNEQKRALLALLKKHGEPITQWNPLVLELLDAELLKEAKLSNINLEMVSLRAIQGQVSLAGCQLENAALLCANLNHACLDDADLSGADLRYADLTEASLERATLVEANLEHAKLSFANFQEANLYCAKLHSALVKHAIFQEANLRKADLRNADFYQANLRTARLQQADLRDANLFMADLTGARLRHADLRTANLGFALLTEVRLQQARLNGTNLNSADLTEANLEQCTLSGALLNRTILKDTNLTATELYGIDLSDCCDLETANLMNALIDNNTQLPKGFKPRKSGIINKQCSGLQRIGNLVSALFG